MKRGRISTDHGIFEIDHDGFYVPLAEPEPKVSGLWLMAMGIGTFAAVCFVGAYFVLEAIAGA